MKEKEYLPKEENSWAYEVLKELKSQCKRYFIIMLVLIATNLLSIGYLVYTLSDIGYYAEDNEQQIQDVETIENSTIRNGD